MISIETLTALGLLKQEAGYLATSGDVGISSQGQKFLLIAGGLLDMFETLGQVHNAAQAAHKASTGAFFVPNASPAAEPAPPVIAAPIELAPVEAPAPAVAAPVIDPNVPPSIVAPVAVAPPPPPPPTPQPLEIDPSNPAYAAIQALLNGGK